MNPSQLLQELRLYIEEFEYWSNKRLSWPLQTLFYFPVGMIIEGYWTYKMQKLNREWLLKNREITHEKP